MRARLARLLLAAAKRLDPDVVPSGGSILGPPRSVEVEPGWFSVGDVKFGPGYQGRVTGLRDAQAAVDDAYRRNLANGDPW